MKKPDLRTLEMEVMNIEDPNVREALLDILKVLKAHESDLLHIFTYAEGVR